MTDWKPSRPRPHLVRRSLAQLRSATSVLVWCAVTGAVIWLGTMSPTLGPMVGFVAAARSEVRSPVAGRIAAITVTLHEQVEKDQIIGRLDDSELRLRLVQATCELERHRAEVMREEADRIRKSDSAQAEYGLDSGVEQRRLITGVESAQLATLSTRAQIEEARVRAQGAEVEAGRLDALAQQGVIAEPELLRVRTERDALHKRISELEALHREHLARIETANQRLREFSPEGPQSQPIEAALAPLRWRLEAQKALLDRIAEDAQMLVLRAPIRGRVASVVAASGEWIEAGRSVVTIVDADPRRILAYVPDTMRDQIAAARGVVVRRQDASLLGNAAIESISPSVVLVPERLWRDPSRAEWAYELVVAATGLERPGERVQLALVR